MKVKYYLVLLFLINEFSAFSQSPQQFKYQAIARDTSGMLISNRAVNLRISILQGSINGSAVYTETHLKTTNSFGQVSLDIGAGNIVSGVFANINWGNNLYYIKTEMDANGGNSFIFMGTSQFVSVPYALHAKTAETIIGGITETDPKVGYNTTGFSPKWNGSSLVTGAIYQDANGKIGVGTTNPNYNLDVVGNGSMSMLYDRDNTSFYIDPASISILNDVRGSVFYDKDNTTYYLDPANETNSAILAGKVGLGTTTPATKLDVVGVITATGGNSTNWNTAYTWGNHSGLYRPIGWVPTWTDITAKPSLFDGSWLSLTGKPTFSTIAISGSYNDLSNKPTIPATQVNSDWNSNSGLSQILNKPVLFDGNYNSLTNKPILTNGTVTYVTANLPISVTQNASTPVISINKADNTTDGYLSTTDWNIFNNKQSSIAGNNFQTLMYNGTWMASTLIYNDDSKMGIGTTTPADVTHTLTIMGTGSSDILRLIGPGAFGSNAKINFGDANYVNLSEDADDKLLIFATGRTAIMGGNVGINTTSPTQKFEVNNGNILLSNTGTASELRINEPFGSGTNYTAFNTQAQTADITYTLPATNGNSGQVLSNNGSGVLSWSSSPSINSLRDADDNTKVQVEENANENIIRFDLNGIERWVMNGARLESKNTGGSVFIGDSAGFSDDLFIRNNTFIGYTAGRNNTIGSMNTAIGFSALYSNTSGNYNIANGFEALYSNTTGSYNTVEGKSALYSNKANSRSTAIGYNAIYYADNTTSGHETYNTAIGYEALKGSITASANIGQWNTVVGDQALYSNTTGGNNTANGFRALYSNTTGYLNTVNGSGALFSNTIGNNNTAIGFNALYYNTSGGNNTANGLRALYSNKANSRSTAIGYNAMYYADNTTSGHETYNTAIGYEALKGSSNASANTGQWNTAIGDQVLYSNSSGGNNTATGYAALYSNTSAWDNTANGYAALYSNTTGSENTANGYNALLKNYTGSNNTASGAYALQANTTGNENTAVGVAAMNSNTYGAGNTAFGYSALSNNNGNSNTAIGNFALNTNTIGTYNTAIGYSANVSANNLTNATAIGYLCVVNASNKVLVGNTAVTSIGGQVGWSTFSDKRLKTNISESNLGLNFILKLKPVNYNYTAEGQKGIRYTGFIAQDVENTLKELGTEFSGIDKPKNNNDFYSLRYAEFTVPLVKAVQEQQKEIETQKLLIEKQQQLIIELSKRIEAIEHK